MKLEKKYLSYLRKNADMCSYGIDYITISTPLLLEVRERFRGLDTNNSNYNIKDGDHFVYTSTMTVNAANIDILVTISVGEISYPIMKLSKFHNNKLNNIQAFVTIYSTCFRLIEKKIIPGLMELLKDYFSDADYHMLCDSRLSRMDFRLDLFYNKPQTFPSHKKLITSNRAGYSEFENQRFNSQRLSRKMPSKLRRKTKKIEVVDEQGTQRMYNSKNQLNGRCYGKSTSKTLIVRCYDKKLDSLVKNKRDLYDDYFSYSNVYRLEAEFKTKTLGDPSNARGYKLSDIGRVVEELAKPFFGIGFIPERSGYHYKPNKDVLEIGTRYINQTKTRLKVLHSNNINLYALTKETYNDLGVGSEKQQLLLGQSK